MQGIDSFFCFLDLLLIPVLFFEVCFQFPDVLNRLTVFFAQSIKILSLVGYVSLDAPDILVNSHSILTPLRELHLRQAQISVGFLASEAVEVLFRVRRRYLGVLCFRFRIKDRDALIHRSQSVQGILLQLFHIGKPCPLFIGQPADCFQQSFMLIKNIAGIQFSFGIVIFFISFQIFQWLPCRFFPGAFDI